MKGTGWVCMVCGHELVNLIIDDEKMMLCPKCEKRRFPSDKERIDFT
jgi:DNA-directed RNA polymerase subunit RPC12/RpoP